MSTEDATRAVLAMRLELRGQRNRVEGVGFRVTAFVVPRWSVLPTWWLGLGAVTAWTGCR